ncbi:C40 family peptidase [Streptomyces sp. YIM S03343]
MRDSDPFGGGDGPSRAEVQRRIDRLYDRAETDSRTFNATRAMALGTSSSAGAPVVRPASGRARGGSDPALDSVTRQWFDAARGSIGPTVAAALPRDLLPGRSPAALPGPPAERPDYSATIRELEAAARPVLELTAGTAPAPAALPPAERTAALPELTAAPTELLPPATEPAWPPAQLPPAPMDSAPGTGSIPGIPAQPTAARPAVTEPPAPTPAVPGASPAPWATATPATRPSPASTAHPDRSAMGPAKERNRLKLTAAHQLLARRTAQLAPQAPAIPAAPAPMAPQTQPTWPTAPDPTGQWLPQQPDDYGTTTYAAPTPTAAQDPATGSIPTVPSAPTLPTITQPPLQATPGKAAAALDFARAQLGRPCLWGAAGPEAYDCGGLTQAAWRAAGVTLPRTAPEQASAGTLVPLTELQPGDLLFFQDGPSHVGLVTGNGLMIHAPGPGASVREESVFFAGPQAIQGAIRPA